MEKIKVLHVAPLPPPLGGMVTYILGLLNSDIHEKVDTAIVRFDYLNKEAYRGPLRLAVNIANALILTTLFSVKLLVWKPKIVHIQSNSGFGFYEKSYLAFLAQLFGVKTVFHVHGGNFRQFYTQSPPFFQKLILWLASRNDFVLTASPQMRETWLFIGLREEKLRLIGNAVDLPDEVREHFQGENIVILFLTRIIQAKGVFELIDAVDLLHEQYPQIRLRIVGVEELETADVKKHLGSLRLANIQYVGPVSEGQKQQEYLNADIFAFPTHVEDQSYAVMEAMSYGLACVASDVGGVPSLIADKENGVLIPPKDTPALVAALAELIEDASLRSELGARARETIQKKFTWKRHADEVWELYKECLTGS